MKKTSETSIRKQVYNSIFQDIINGNLNFDEYLTEKFLMEKYNVSRAPVREALMQLRSDRIITSVPRHGYLIRRPDQRELRDIVKFRAIIECSFLEQYHYMITPNQISELRQLCHEYSEINPQDKNFISYWKANRGFHAKLFSSYGNEFALRSLLDSIDCQVIYFVQVMQAYYLAADLHFAMLDYLEKGDIKTAVSLLRADLEKIPTDDNLLQTGKNSGTDTEKYSISLC